jgi:hypothetical protein
LNIPLDPLNTILGDKKIGDLIEIIIKETKVARPAATKLADLLLASYEKKILVEGFIGKEVCDLEFFLSIF